MSDQPTTPAQLRRRVFAELVAKGEKGAAAARLAGYRGNVQVLSTQAHRMLKNAEVQDLIEQARKASSSSRIATAEQLKAFWTDIVSGAIKDADGTPAKMSDRIKAAELLAKTQGLFLERTKQEGQLDITIRRGADAPAALQNKDSK